MSAQREVPGGTRRFRLPVTFTLAERGKLPGQENFQVPRQFPSITKPHRHTNCRLPSNRRSKHTRSTLNRKQKQRAPGQTSLRFSVQQQDCATRSFFAKFLDHREVCSLLISLEALELRRWRRSFTIRLAGVAELADGLDSKFRNHRFYLINCHKTPFTIS